MFICTHINICTLIIICLFHFARLLFIVGVSDKDLATPKKLSYLLSHIWKNVLSCIVWYTDVNTKSSGIHTTLTLFFLTILNGKREIERHQYYISGSIPNKLGWQDSPKPSSNLVYANTPLWTAKCILLFSNQPSHFLPQPAFFMSSLASPSSFDHQPQNVMPFLGHDRPHSSTHDHTNEHCLPLPTDLWFYSNTT